MKVSNKCIELIKEFEGFSAKPYLCPAGVMTLGYGMTGKEIEGLKSVTKVQASDMLTKLVNEKYATPIDLKLSSVPCKLNQNEFDALVSLAYNIGVGGLLGSTLFKNVCSGIRDVGIITSIFRAWNKATIDGTLTVLDGLTNRRTKEASLFFESVIDTVKKEVIPKSAKVTASILNVRQEPNSDGLIIGKLAMGSTVNIDKKYGEWYSIFYGNNGGYVNSKYVK
jgi:GH24 family phage-related lysozyme (muramidase)